MNKTYKIVHPLNIFIFGWLFWWAIFLITPYSTDLDYYYNHIAFPLLIKYNLIFLAGVITAIFFITKKKQSTNITLSIDSLAKPLFFILVIALIADILQTIDFSFTAGKHRTFADAREEFRAQGSIFPDPIWTTMFLFFKLSGYPIFVVLLFLGEFRRKYPALYYFSILVAIYPLVNLIGFGKKAYMTITLGIYVWYAIYFRLFKNKINILKLLFVFFMSFVIGGATFMLRSGGTGESFLNLVTEDYNYAETVNPTDEFVYKITDMIEERDVFNYGLRLSWMVFAQYYNHGVFEFFHLYDHKPKDIYRGGTFTLSMPYKVLINLGIVDRLKPGVDIPEESVLDNKNWVFDSFFGGQLKDFGENGTFYSLFFIGLIFGAAYRLAQSNVFAFPLYINISNVVFFFPVTDLITNGQFWHYATLSIGFYLYMTMKTKTKSRPMISQKTRV